MFAGAMHSLFLIRDNELIEVKGNRVAIGGPDNKDVEHTSFTTHVIRLFEKDVVYFTTDGYIDQFHHKTEKRYGRTRLKQLLLQINDKSMEEQKRMVLDEHEKWRKGTRQTDDICFVAFKLKSNAK